MKAPELGHGFILNNHIQAHFILIFTQQYKQCNLLISKKGSAPIPFFFVFSNPLLFPSDFLRRSPRSRPTSGGTKTGRALAFLVSLHLNSTCSPRRVSHRCTSRSHTQRVARSASWGTRNVFREYTLCVCISGVSSTCFSVVSECNSSEFWGVF